MKKYFLFFFVITILSMNSNAQGILANNTKITGIANISSNDDGLYLTVSGGDGVCAKGSIFFKAENMPNQSTDALNRAMSLAMLAFTADYYVQLYNYIDDNCHGITYIRIQKNPF